MADVKILIVDDDLVLTKAIKIILEKDNYSVVTAADRMEGMKKARAEQPDLIILDVMMATWKDGFEMAKELKKDSQSLKDIPILMMTGIKDVTGIDFKYSAGDPTWCPVEGFLDKPVESEVLLAEVKKLLQK